MWFLESTDREFELLFRMFPGEPKTLGRAPRADFIVDAPLVSIVGDVQRERLDAAATREEFVTEAEERMTVASATIDRIEDTS